MNYFSEQALYNFASREPRLFFGRDDAKDHADPPARPSIPANKEWDAKQRRSLKRGLPSLARAKF